MEHGATHKTASLRRNDAALDANSIVLPVDVDRRHYCAVPVNGVDVCTPAASVIVSVAGPFAPAVSVVGGRNCTVTAQDAPGARVV